MSKFISPTLSLELELWSEGYRLVAGLDEVGRGSFAGPVVVGAVIFPTNIVLPPGIADSKLVTPKNREILSKKIKELALDWAIGEISVEIINQIGIGKATDLAFRQAVNNLKKNPDFLLIDAFFISQIERNKQKAVLEGDSICASISAASIIAKVYRDNLMVDLDQKYPEYGFAKHKGYGTKDHRDALKKHGMSPIHRTSFNLTKFLPH